ncbi:MAG: OmpA family protein [Fulvivirga sp.]|nr:OmpA family protein [Fulvivirga sp.]
MKIRWRKILTGFLSLIYFGAFSQKAPVETLRHDSDLEIKALTQLNSKFRETNLSITPDGKLLFFMSDRGGMPWSQEYGKYKGSKSYDGDIWYSRKVDGEWQPPICLDNTINTSEGEDEPIISPDGQKVIFQSWKNRWKQTGGPYYQAELSGSAWKDPEGLSDGINVFFIGNYNRSDIGYATDGATVSPDGKTFIVACGEDYNGPMDLYMSKKKDGQWQFPEKLAISTAGDERSVFLAGDGSTLYFASDGYDGFGGLDIYKTTLNDDGTFGEVINIGKPFNTKNDDYGFIIASSGQEAFFVRNGDIFTVTIKNADPKLRARPVLIISGQVRDARGNFIETYLNLFDVKKHELLAISHTNRSTGRYSFSVPLRSTSYQILDTGRTTIDTIFSVTKTDDYLELAVDLSARQVSEETMQETPKLSDTLKQVTYFEYDQAVLTAYGKQKLNALLDTLNKQEDYQISVTGHTDSVGSMAYNQRLGKRRAAAVKQYLVKQGLHADRIATRSYGESRPVSQNKSTNRRVEIAVIYKEE